MNENQTVPVPQAAQRPALLPHPSKLFVEVTTRCNLHCSMCLKDAQGIAEGDISREAFARLRPAFPRLDALVLNGIGEPLLHPLLETFIEDARRAMPASAWIGFQTNGQLLTRERARSLAGAVHPCYFLWHRYSSHIGGVVKRVGPLSFANLAAQDVLAVWNGAAARVFREGVLRYDYPFCYDCTVALCDYVQGEEFVQDCYMSAVPCGACLWSTGVFQCLR